MVLFCIFFINSFCILLSQRHQFYLLTTASEYLRIFNSILPVLLAVNKPFCRIFKWNPYILALQCGHQLIDDNRKPDGRCGFAEGFQQIVITSAVYNGLSAAKSITGKNNTCIIIKTRDHSQFVRYIFVDFI